MLIISLTLQEENSKCSIKSWMPRMYLTFIPFTGFHSHHITGKKNPSTWYAALLHKWLILSASSLPNTFFNPLLFFFFKYLVLSISCLLPGITFSFPTWDKNYVLCMTWIHSKCWIQNVNVILSTTFHILIHAKHPENIWTIVNLNYSSPSSLPFSLPHLYYE